MTAAAEKLFGSRFLKVASADELTWNLCGDCKDRYAIFVAVIKPIYKVQISWSAASRTNRQRISEVSLSSRSECRHFLMSNVNPLERLFGSNNLSNSLSRISTNSIKSFHSRFGEGAYEKPSGIIF